jgi:transposase-like protein
MVTTKKNLDKPYTANYPVLEAWLQKHEAQCNWQLPIGDKRNPQGYVESWFSRSWKMPVVIIVWAKQRGWDIYTAPATNSGEVTLQDAEDRVLAKHCQTCGKAETDNERGYDDGHGRYWCEDCGSMATEDCGSMATEKKVVFGVVPELNETEKKMLREGSDFISVIKSIRSRTTSGLKEAHEAVSAFRRNLRSPTV